MNEATKKRFKVYLLIIAVATPHVLAWAAGAAVLGPPDSLGGHREEQAGLTLLGVFLGLFTVMATGASLVLRAPTDDPVPIKLRVKTTVVDLLGGWIIAVPWSLVLLGIFFINLDQTRVTFLGYTFFVGLVSAIVIPSLYAALSIVSGIEVFVPGQTLREFGDEEESMRWMINEERFSKRARLEVATYLAEQGPLSVAAALTCDLPDDARTQRAIERTLEELELEGARQVIRTTIGRLESSTLRALFDRWTDSPRRAELLSAIASDVQVAADPDWAPRIARVAFDEGIDDGQTAATAVLGMQALGLHERALDYLERFGRPIDIPALEAARDGFSLNLGLDKQIDALIERIRARHGVAVGALTVAAPSAEGGLSVAAGEVGDLTQTPGDE